MAAEPSPPPTSNAPALQAELREPPSIDESAAADAAQLPPLYSAHKAAGVLKNTGALFAHPKRGDETLPTFISADRINGINDVEVVAEGRVEIRQRDTTITSDRMIYRQDSGDMEVSGNVDIVRNSDRIRGPKLRINNENSTGFFEQPEYSIRRRKLATPAAALELQWATDRASSDPHSGPAHSGPELTTGHGKAARLELLGDGHYRLDDATYSTCEPKADGDPDWFARTSSLRLDYGEDVGTARNATLYFKGVPVLYSPWLTFSLNRERKSGLLAPTLGSTSRGGFEFTQPFYWNIAANQDLTVSPRWMSKRGVLWNGEYRYLQTDYYGTFQGQIIPDDRLDRRRRSSYTLNHQHHLGYGVTGSLIFNGASDDTFLSDMSNSSSVIAQTNLLRQGSVGYSGEWWSANLLAQSFQTLQDPSLPKVAEPYRRLPQLTLTAYRSDLPLGVNFSFKSEHVNFRHPSLVEGQRLTVYPQLSLPLQTSAFYLTPKIGVHATRYRLDRQAVGTPDTLTRDLPIFSADAGVVFERPARVFDNDVTQTLEPRLYYLYIPTRDQNLIPVFDSGAVGFDFAQIFSENRYAGGDRIGDADQITAMLTSRLLSTQTGSEILRAGFGQRIYFSTQKVGLPGENLRTDRQTDFLGALSGRLLPSVYLDSGLQYNPRNNRMERINLGGRYQPEARKIFNAAYRYTRDQLGQVDFSGQWPLQNGWHGLGRINYSTKDRRMVESVVGFEYDGGCWTSRFVLQRLATQIQRSNTAIFIQLEFTDFARIGANPLELLKRNVPGYGVIAPSINEPTLVMP